MIAFALIAIVLVAGVPVRWLAIAGARRRRRPSLVFALVKPYAVGAPDLVHRTLGARQDDRLPGGARARSRSARAASSAAAPAQSVQKDCWLPEAPTDFILAVIGEELGFVGIAALLFLYGLIAYAGMRAARRRARTPTRCCVAVGVTVADPASRRSLNVFAVLGIAPVTGVPLPFVSYGAEQPARDARRHGAARSTSPAAARRTCGGAQHAGAKTATIRG